VPAPAIRLRFWQENGSTAPGSGRTRSEVFCRGNPVFEKNWEILYDF
jgi:hypothetical protein